MKLYWNFVEFQIFVIVLKADAIEKIKTNIQNLKCPNQCGTKDIQSNATYIIFGPIVYKEGRVQREGASKTYILSH
jgi:hypothetical protein